MEIPVLAQWGPLTVTPYGLMMALGAALALLVTMLQRRYTAEDHLDVWLCGTLGAWLGSHIGYVLIRLEFILADYNSGWTMLYKPYLGGYTMYGAVFGALLGLALLGLAKRQPLGRLMDLAVPGACVALAVGRAAEAFTDQGVGTLIEDPALQRLPFAICTYLEEDWSEWHLAVFVFEALAAVILLALMCTLRFRRDGERTECFLVLLSASQILMEQMRMDDYLSFSFVRVTQLGAIATILAVALLRMRREGMSSRWNRQRIPLMVCGAAVVVFAEFCFEKPQMAIWLKLSAVLLAAACAVAHLWCRKPAHRGIRAALLTVESLLALAAVLFLGRGLDWEPALLWCLLTAALIPISWAALGRPETPVEAA